MPLSKRRLVRGGAANQASSARSGLVGASRKVAVGSWSTGCKAIAEDDSDEDAPIQTLLSTNKSVSTIDSSFKEPAVPSKSPSEAGLESPSDSPEPSSDEASSGDEEQYLAKASCRSRADRAALRRGATWSGSQSDSDGSGAPSLHSGKQKGMKGKKGDKTSRPKKKKKNIFSDDEG
eukprot:CAMPEP_0119329006 /NCGR_PEP_ID=MMETSP1333-20130426/74797_1 /TAXON_ID=418940 /ORGANISM="Scyphosphaera apsteinii, Strain RCC1455" /LENGTH=176 /DNA_ID=CAMNT_0007338015 /DNA_START=67 /DNA_END=594 /DNA_ORIENTATION=+